MNKDKKKKGIVKISDNVKRIAEVHWGDRVLTGENSRAILEDLKRKKYGI